MSKQILSALLLAFICFFSTSERVFCEESGGNTNLFNELARYHQKVPVEDKKAVALANRNKGLLPGAASTYLTQDNTATRATAASAKNNVGVQQLSDYLAAGPGIDYP